MKRSRKGTAAVLAVLAAVMLLGCGMFDDFDAKGYVQALLDQSFQGDGKAAAEIMEDTTEAELKKQYEEEISNFVENNITAGTTMDDVVIGKYTALCKEIFRGMKYKVKEEKKISKTEYDVDVEIEPSDVFINFVGALKVKSESMMNNAKNGAYEGSEEEINKKLKEEFEQVSYNLLEESYRNMKFGEKQTIVIKVKANDKNEFSADKEEISNLIVKIMRLDEIQD